MCFVVLVDDEPVGQQDLTGNEFDAFGTVESTSWVSSTTPARTSCLNAWATNVTAWRGPRIGENRYWDNGGASTARHGRPVGATTSK
jgi:hypothetical protein